MRATIEQIPGGRAGLVHKIRRIREYVEAAKRDPDFRHTVAQVVAHLPAHDHDAELAAVVDFVRRRVRYLHDPWSPDGFEFFQKAPLLLRQALAGVASGDCDDMVILGSAMLESIGFPTRYRVSATAPEVYNHIWLEVQAPRRGWTPVELTYTSPAIGWDPSSRFPIVETFSGLGGSPMVTNQLVHVPGGHPSMLVPVRYANPRYHGLLPSDLKRLRRLLGSDERVRAMQQLAELGVLAGWFDKITDTVKSIGRKIDTTLRPYYGQILSTAATAIPGVGPVVSMGVKAAFDAKNAEAAMRQMGQRMLVQGGGGAYDAIAPLIPQWLGPMMQQPLMQQFPQIAYPMQAVNYPATRRITNYPRFETPDQFATRNYLPPGTAILPPPEAARGVSRTTGYSRARAFSLFGLGGLGAGEISANKAALTWLQSQAQPAFVPWFDRPEWQSYLQTLELDARAKADLRSALSRSLANVYAAAGWGQAYPKTGGWERVSKDWGQLNRSIAEWFAYLAWTWAAHPEAAANSDPGWRERWQALYVAVRDYWRNAWDRAVADTQARAEAKRQKERDAKKIDELRKRFDALYGKFWEAPSLSKLNELAQIAMQLGQLLGNAKYRHLVEDLNSEFQSKNEAERQRKAEEARKQAEAARKQAEAEAQRRREAEQRAAQQQARMDAERQRRMQLPSAYPQPRPGQYGPPAPPAAAAGLKLSPALLIGGGLLAILLLKRR
jgi:hypothetical protein